MVWTAENIKVVKTDRDAKKYGARATSWEFSADILADGVLHHVFQQFDVVPGNIQPDILDHLALCDSLASFDPASVPITLSIPVPKPPNPPTQDELDLQAFLALLRDLKEKKAALGTSKTLTQQDVDVAKAAMTAAYKEAYAPFLVGL